MYQGRNNESLRILGGEYSYRIRLSYKEKRIPENGTFKILEEGSRKKGMITLLRRDIGLSSIAARDEINH